MDHKIILDRLGTVLQTADALGVRRKTVENWRARGVIPPRHWDTVVAKYNATCVPITIDDLHSGFMGRARRVTSQ